MYEAQFHRCMTELQNIGDKLWCEGIGLHANNTGSYDFFCAACADWYPDSSSSHWTQALDKGTSQDEATPHYRTTKHV